MTNTYFYDETQLINALRTWTSVVFPGTGDNTPLRKVTTLMVVSLCDPIVQVAAAAAGPVAPGWRVRPLDRDNSLAPPSG